MRPDISNTEKCPLLIASSIACAGNGGAWTSNVSKTMKSCYPIMPHFFKNIFDSWILWESMASFESPAFLQFNHGPQAFPAPPTVIERVGILVANSERFQCNRMLGDQAGLVEACRLTAIVRQ